MGSAALRVVRSPVVFDPARSIRHCCRRLRRSGRDPGNRRTATLCRGPDDERHDSRVRRHGPPVLRPGDERRYHVGNRLSDRRCTTVHTISLSAYRGNLRGRDLRPRGPRPRSFAGRPIRSSRATALPNLPGCRGSLAGDPNRGTRACSGCSSRSPPREGISRSSRRCSTARASPPACCTAVGRWHGRFRSPPCWERFPDCPRRRRPRRVAARHRCRCVSPRCSLSPAASPVRRSRRRHRSRGCFQPVSSASCEVILDERRSFPTLPTGLHGYLQDLAGKRSGEPLTFGDLDVRIARPGDRRTWHRSADDDDRAVAGSSLFAAVRQRAVLFQATSLRCTFPSDVIEWMVAQPGDRSNANRARDDAIAVVRLPAAAMRAKRCRWIVAVRLSLSFPVLLSAVPLYRYAWERFDRGTGAGAVRREGTYAAENAAIPPGDDTSDVDAAPSAAATTAREPRFIEANVRRVLFSDGGICSNFPLQMFDAVLPGWPTFGINLRDDLTNRRAPRSARTCRRAAARCRPRTTPSQMQVLRACSRSVRRSSGQCRTGATICSAQRPVFAIGC